MSPPQEENMPSEPRPYHLRRPDQEITDPAELQEIIRAGRYMTIALCREGEPYLVTVSYGYDAEARCFYFHCAPEGKKIDYLRANPIAWGQVLEDRGYQAGACDHAFRSVHFRGRAEFVQDLEAKRGALALMIEQLEPNPEPVRQRLLNEQRVCAAGIVRVQVLEMTGKRSHA
jgi:nitroimidazol reductase NimA-like FMN-containing flavoprotein (pyridoxamine 5'-phosphate oxidase superfamily)